MTNIKRCSTSHYEREISVKRNILEKWTASSGRLVLAQQVLPGLMCEPVVHSIYNLLRFFLHLGAPTISEVSLALFRSVGWCDLDSASVVPAVRQNTGSGARTGFWQTPLLGRTLLRALLCCVSGITLPLSAEYAVKLFAFSIQVFHI